MTTQQTLIVGMVGVALGAGITYALTRNPAHSPQATATAAPTGSPAKASEPIVMLSSEAVSRANITVARAEAGTATSQLRIPATVAANAYRQTVVSALVSGRVTRVEAELGAQVHAGDVLAVLYSPDLAEAERQYLSSKAELEAHELKLARTSDLLQRGVASQQELEQAHAEHTAMTTAVEGARARLQLLGVTAKQIDLLTSVSQMTATTELLAPTDGVVIARQANPGMNVQSAESLFTVADLSKVWVVGNLFEKDFRSVRVGSPVQIVLAAYPDQTVQSTVSYIDPQLNVETRTAKVRAEIGNPHRDLRVGMFGEMVINAAGGTPTMVIPKSAVQRIGNASVVYVPDAANPGKFLERRVETGPESGDKIEIRDGLAADEPVVATGSFLLRAERERISPGSQTAAEHTH